MTKVTNPLRLALEDVLAPAGFSRKGDSWFRRTDDVVEVVNLQKSQYGQQYHLNHAVWLRTLGEETFPREEKCHIRIRVSAILDPESGTQLDRLLDLDTDIEDPKRQAELASLLVEKFLPFSDAARTVSGLRSLLESGRLKNAMVHVRAKAALAPSA